MELYMFLLLLAGLIGTGTAQSTTTATTVTTGSTSGGTSATQTSTQPGTTAVTTGSTSGGTSATQTSTQPGTTAVTTGSTSGETSATQTSTQPGTTAVTTGSTSGGTSATQTSTQPGTTAVTTGSTSGETSAKQTSTQPGTTASTTTTTTAAPTTTTTRRPPPPPEPKIELQFSVQETFSEDLKDETSPRFIELKGEVTKGLDKTYRDQFGDEFNRTEVRGFRQGSIIVDAELIFNNITTLPNTSDVTETLKNATTSNAFNFTVNTQSISARVAPPPTTAAPTTATPSATSNMTANSTTPPMTTTSNMTANSTTPPMTATSNMTTNSTTTPATANSTTSPANGTSAQPHNQTTPTTQVPVTTMMTTVPADSRLRLGFRLNQTFESGLENPQSSVFRNLADRLERQLFNSFRRRFRFLLRVLILRFSQGSVVVDSELQFPNASSVPEPREVENALVEEANTSSNLTLVPGSVVVTRANETTNTTANSTTATTTTAANSTTASATTTSGSTGPPTGSEGSLSIRFSLNRTFIPALATSGSPEFIELASTVVKEINRICKILFSGFLRSLVNSFTEGSVVTNMTLVFRDASSVPDLNTAQSQLASALLTSNVLNYINGSLVVEPTTTSSSPPQPTLGGLTIFSLTMLAVAQMLINS
ncbi:mucin-5AC-like isoform X30 [Cyprinodon tularosa]|uniref:mucin-5AC-like isoform X30 n=1 Tax=Cyprinodon tularosa TaxID=77115 RepID=UPI0018E21509|nr:mucin-5AC-like isoform X30 [Cyprinodon tularosa]